MTFSFCHFERACSTRCFWQVAKATRVYMRGSSVFIAERLPYLYSDYKKALRDDNPVK